jgi:predicted O-linked N-acetylglucosamine transferase (SPINDLY family)
MSASSSQNGDKKMMESQKIKDAINYLKSGQLEMAQNFLAEVISNNSNSDEALHLMGLVLCQQNQLQQAYDLISRAITLNPKNSLYYSNRGEIIRQMGNPRLAIEDLDLAILIDSKNASLFFNRAVAYQQLKDFALAIDNYRAALDLGLKNFQIYFYLGNIYAELSDYGKATEAYQAALNLNPNNSQVWANLGYINDRKQLFQEAIECYRKSIALNPDDATTYSNLGKSLYELNAYEESILACNKSIELNPHLAAAYSNQADALTKLKKYEEALVNYEKAINLNPSYYQAYFNCAGAFMATQDYSRAILALDSAIKINPLSADAFYNRSVAKFKNKDLQSSIDDSEVALRLKPEIDYLLGGLMSGYLSLGEWEKFEQYRKVIPSKIENFKRVAHPLQIMMVFDSLDYLKTTASLLIKQRYDTSAKTFNIKQRKHSKIRIGYFSEVFKIHPVAYLLAEVLELHDRAQFEIHAFSFSKDRPDVMTERISRAVNQFYDVRLKTTEEVVELARSLNLDIAIDLGIFTAEQLLVFKERVAPVQVNYLGYAGTSGSQYMDYIIADEFTIPGSAENYYTEKVVRLPCFMPRDTKLKPSGRKFTRDECGLPDHGFVFCCTSGYGKIIPETFATWMRILKLVPGSCLWLSANKDSQVMNRLRDHAEKLGVNSKRLVFAERLDSPADYLARLGLADLFLDTFPYGAHTLSNDALWAGVPVLTRVGETFASRVAGSFLTQLQLTELITTNFDDYEKVAVKIGNNPQLAKALKQKLFQQRDSSTMFNSTYYAQKLEESFKAIYNLSIEHSAPKTILIRP